MRILVGATTTLTLPVGKVRVRVWCVRALLEVAMALFLGMLCLLLQAAPWVYYFSAINLDW